MQKKSAEVIVVAGNEPLERTEASQSSEGLNIKLFQMLHGVYSHVLSGTEKTKEVTMIEQVINRRNMHLAYQQVLRNKGSAGVDGMQVSELKHYIRQYREAVATSIILGKYQPQSIVGIFIPKSNGKTRLLGIPTVVDRWLQQSVTQAITPLFEFEFKDHSYGFRPNKNAHQCVQQSKQYIDEGYQHIVDIDLKNFFDEVDHCLLLELLYRKVKCPVTLRLIRKWLRAPIMIHGKLTKRRKGVPQGSPLSPLLSNIMLHELDKELEKQGLKYVRYADDLVSTLKAKAQQGKRVTQFIFS